MAKHRYNMGLGIKLDDDLNKISEYLGISKAEVMRRALSLFIHAVSADEVKLITGGRIQDILVK